MASPKISITISLSPETYHFSDPSPPELTITVTSKSDKPLTIFTHSTILDPHLGLFRNRFTITNLTNGLKVRQSNICIKRFPFKRIHRSSDKKYFMTIHPGVPSIVSTKFGRKVTVILNPKARRMVTVLMVCMVLSPAIATVWASSWDARAVLWIGGDGEPRMISLWLKLYIYPIKSLRAVPLSSAVLTTTGFPYDRRFMLFKIEQDGPQSERKLTRMTVTFFPQMGLFTQEVQLSQGKFAVTFTPPPNTKEEQKTLSLPLEPEFDTLEEVTVSLHGSDAKARNMGKQINDWFSSCFEWEVMLVYLPPGRTRKVLGNLAPNSATVNSNQEAAIAGQHSWFSTLTKYVPSYLQMEEVKEKDKGITFADCAPYLVVTQESLDDVTARLVTGLQADVTKFRPNIVLEGAESAYEEDYWGAVSILSESIHPVDIVLTQNCIRCQSLDIDYSTGTYARGDKGTILKKLMRDRRVDEGKKYSPVFGRYGFLVEKGDSPGALGGRVMIGDEVQVSKRNEERTKFCTYSR
ncbi:MAG: hypothetical protein Q9213_006746 [Squamulea squamosa]